MFAQNEFWLNRDMDPDIFPNSSYTGVEACLTYGACWEGSEEGFEIDGDTGSEDHTNGPPKIRKCTLGSLRTTKYIIAILWM